MKDITEKGIKYIDAQVEECVQNIQLPIPGYYNYKEPIPDHLEKDKKGRIKIRNKREIIQALLVAIEADFGRKLLEEQSQDPLQTFCLSLFQKFMTDSGFGLNNASSKIKSAYTRFVPESVRRVGFKLSRAMVWSIKFIYNNPYVVMILSLLVKVVRIVACLYTQGVNWKQIKAFAYVSHVGIIQLIQNLYLVFSNLYLVFFKLIKLVYFSFNSKNLIIVVYFLFACLSFIICIACVFSVSILYAYVFFASQFYKKYNIRAHKIRIKTF